MERLIRVRGARTHNLADVNVDLPHGAWTLVCGVSGSGKSSLVLDTLATESKRRYLGTLRHAVRGVDLLPRPDVDSIDGLPPAVASGFRPRAPSRRQTLGTLTEITRGLRVLFARLGTPHCPTCHAALETQDAPAILQTLLELPEGSRLLLLVPAAQRGGAALAEAQTQGFVRVRIDGQQVVRLDDFDATTVADEAQVEIVIDRLVVRASARDRFAASIEQALALSGGRMLAVPADGVPDAPPLAFATQPTCARCDLTYPALRPAALSYDHPEGACETCGGRGTVDEIDAASALPDELPIKRVHAHLAPALPTRRRRALREVVRAWRERPDVAKATSVGQLSAKTRDALWTARLPAAPSTPAKKSAATKARPDAGPAQVGQALMASERRARLARAVPCAACEGARLAPYARGVHLAGRAFAEVDALLLSELPTWLESVPLEGAVGHLVAPVVEDLRQRAGFLRDLGLGYLALGRPAPTLSHGELRRAELAATCAARMSGLLFLLDEPTAGLHPTEREPLWRRLRAIVEEGNTLVCVDHDPRMLGHADHVVCLGPGAGREGGRVIHQGPAAAVGDDPTARQAVLGDDAPLVLRDAPRAAVATRDATLRLQQATLRTLKGVDATFPVGGLTVIAGLSGAGKSTLTVEVLAPTAARAVDGVAGAAVGCAGLEGAEHLDRVVVAQGRTGRHARATAGNLLGMLAPLRTLFAQTLEARARGWAASWFSTHAPGGRCETCQGTGVRTLRLPEAPPLRIPCDVCEGRRFRAEAQAARWRGRSMPDLLALSIAEAADTFREVPRVGAPLAAAKEVGLGYVIVGESLAALSSGEVLRLRLAAALGKATRSRTLFVLDEPCTGLHPRDTLHLLEVLLRLCETGHTVVAVEHDPHVVAAADHVIELGPGAGAAGGQVVFAGPPAALAAHEGSPTGRLLREVAAER